MRDAKGTTGYRKRKDTERAAVTFRDYLESLSPERRAALRLEDLGEPRQTCEIADLKPKPTMGTDRLS